MEEKLRILMKNENLTASRLADILDVKPAVISHLLRGRNKPSFELVCKLVNRFPQINPYWLLGDDERIYSSAQGESQPSTSDTNSREGEIPSLFDLVAEQTKKSDKSNIDTTAQSASLPERSSSEIDRILVIYRDKTFEELRSR